MLRQNGINNSQCRELDHRRCEELTTDDGGYLKYLAFGFHHKWMCIVSVSSVAPGRTAARALARYLTTQAGPRSHIACSVAAVKLLDPLRGAAVDGGTLFEFNEVGASHTNYTGHLWPAA